VLATQHRFSSFKKKKKKNKKIIILRTDQIQRRLPEYHHLTRSLVRFAHVLTSNEQHDVDEVEVEFSSPEAVEQIKRL